jgi:hypothetical protein
MEINLTKKQGLTAVIFIVIVAIILVIIGLVFMDKDYKTTKPSSEIIQNDVSKIEWIVYKNKEYKFLIEYPSHWYLFESEGEKFTPAINFYPKESEDVELPYTHQDQITHVSVFPVGVPTGGLVGFEQRQVVGDLVDEEVLNHNQYTLDSGEHWANYITFKNRPKEWKEWGFLWSGIKVQDLEFRCSSGIGLKEIDQCNTFEGDIIKISGNIDKMEKDIVEHMIRSFKFTK